MPESVSEMTAATAALAESWASIDGKLDAYRAGRNGDDFDGRFDGYNIEAAEMIERLKRRGFAVVRIQATEIDRAVYGDDAKPFGLEKWALDQGIEMDLSGYAEDVMPGLIYQSRFIDRSNPNKWVDVDKKRYDELNEDARRIVQIVSPDGITDMPEATETVAESAKALFRPLPDDYDPRN